MIKMRGRLRIIFAFYRAFFRNPLDNDLQAEPPVDFIDA
jgi:hypothetical protein